MSLDHGALSGPVQVDAEVFSNKRVGAYHHLTLVAEGVAERTRPGNFVALAIGGESSSALLRRSFSIYRVRRAGVYGGTGELVVGAVGPRPPRLPGARPPR